MFLQCAAVSNYFFPLLVRMLGLVDMRKNQWPSDHFVFFPERLFFVVGEGYGGVRLLLDLFDVERVEDEFRRSVYAVLSW
jgi:hypothetical protein